MTLINGAPRPLESSINELIEAFTRGDWNQAWLLAQAMINDFPQFALGWTITGSILAQSGHIEGSLPFFEKAVELIPNEPSSHSNLGNVLRDLGYLEASESAYQRAIGLNPNFFEVHNNLGNVLNDLGNARASEAAYREAIRICPEFAQAHANLGNLLRTMGRLEASEAELRTAITLDPGLAEAYCNLGQTLLDLKQLDAAEEELRKSIQIKPELTEAHMSLGMLLSQKERFEEAKIYFQEALILDADLIKAHIALGNISTHSGDLPAAEMAYREALRINPKSVEAMVNLGILLRKNGALDQAERLTMDALEIQPDFSMAHHCLGLLFFDRGWFNQSEMAFRKAILLRDDYAEAHLSLGVLLKELGRFSECETSFQAAIKAQPEWADPYHCLGNLLWELGRYTQAETALRESLRLKPDRFEVHNDLGICLHFLGRLDEAVASYRESLRLNPDFAEGLSNLGNTLRELKRFSEFEAVCREAIRIKPDFAPAYNNLGNALIDLGQLDESEAALRMAIELDPKMLDAHSNLLYTLSTQAICSPHRFLAAANDFSRAASSKGIPPLLNWDVEYPAEKLLVGFVSGDLRSHPVGYFLESFLRNLDDVNIEIIAYPTKPGADDLTLKLQSYINRWEPLYGLTDDVAAEKIRAHGVHILVDLAGHTSGNRLGIFALKPAPIQLSWLGWWATTGLPQIDFILGDPYVTPLAESHHFIEKIWQLPETRFCFTPPIESIPVNELPAIQNHFVTFGCFNDLSKLGKPVIALWSRILCEKPNSKLFLKAKQLSDAALRQETIQRFKAHGIERSRLILEGWSDLSDYFKAYHRVDIALDPFPYPGGTTTAQSLWMGVPVLTIKGDRLLSHQGEGIVSSAGYPEWVAESAETFLKKAIEFSDDLNQLAEERRKMRSNVLHSPLCDAVKFSKNFAAAIKKIWSMHEEKTRTSPLS